LARTTSFGKPFMFIAWGLALVMLVWFFEDQLQQQFNPNSQVQSHVDNGQVTVLLEQNRMGHYVAQGKVNGQSVTFLLDTGATLVAVPENLAARLELGEIQLTNVAASITPGMDGDVILLGMSALKEFELTQKGDTLTLRY